MKAEEWGWEYPRERESGMSEHTLRQSWKCADGRFPVGIDMNTSVKTRAEKRRAYRTSALATDRQTSSDYKAPDYEWPRHGMSCGFGLARQQKRKHAHDTPFVAQSLQHLFTTYIYLIINYILRIDFATRSRFCCKTTSFVAKGQKCCKMLQFVARKRKAKSLWFIMLHLLQMLHGKPSQI